MVVAGKKVLVFGSGISGIGAVKLLEENGADVVLYDGNEKLTEADVRAKLQEGSKARIIIGAFPEELPNTLDLVILSPGVPTDLPIILKMKEKRFRLSEKWNLHIHLVRETYLQLPERMARRQQQHFSVRS